MVCDSELFLASCFSFLIHVVDNLICVFLGSCQLVLLSTLPKFFVPFVVKYGVPDCFEKFHLDWSQSFFILFSKGPNSVSI
jgi:hypothetical protein